MKHYAIIVAGGSGTRFGSSIPKQFLPLCGRPVLMRTIEQFLKCADTEVVVVLPAQQRAYWHELCEQHGFTAPHSVVAGGDSRFQSVKTPCFRSTSPMPTLWRCTMVCARWYLRH